MQIQFKLIVLFLIVLSSNSVFAKTNQYAENSTLFHIENDYISGKISLDDKVILQVNSIKQLNKLPVQYQSTSSVKSEYELRGATIALVQIRSAWGELEQGTKDYIKLALARTETEFIYYSPSGYFKLHYDTTGIHAVSTVDIDNNLIPDFVEQCASYCDSSLAVHLEMGYIYPPTDGLRGGDTLYDVYFESMSYYGYAVPEGFGSYAWNDYYSYLVLNNDFIGFPPNTDPEGNIAGAAKVTVAHEFQHSVQFAYDATEGSWIMEACATFMEEAVFDHVNDNYNYLDDFLGSPHTSLMDNNGLHKYGAFLWPLYLAQNFDTLIHVSAWEAARYTDIFTAYADTLLDHHGWEIDSAYIDFTYWMFNTGSRNDGLHFTEASDYYPLTVSNSHIAYPVGITNSLASVGGYGASYITFFPGTEIGKLKLTFNGSDTRNWYAYVIKSITEDSHVIEPILLDTIQENGEIVVPNFDSYYSVTLVGVNTDEFSSSVLFTYSAEVLLPFEVSSTVLSPTDSFLYSGSARTFDLLVRNDAVIPDIFSIIYWDSQGWFPIDTFSIAIGALDSAIVSLDVTSTQGTPVGEVSQISIKSVSWGDSTVFDILVQPTTISLYRGDVNFSGVIDISDLVYLVDFAFKGGPYPLPSELSSDLDCSGSYDISDLVHMVDFMFNSGPSSPCNPY